MTLRIEDSELLDRDFVVHFPISMSNAWDNVIDTCSMMLLFENETAVDQWCSRFGKNRGDVRPVEQIWEFSRDWYGRHLDQEWEKWSSTEAAEVFARHGLRGPIWTIDSGAEPF